MLHDRLPRLVLIPLLLVGCVSAQTRGGRLIAPTEQRAVRKFEAVRNSPAALNAFLAGMPKGADLHMHLSGAVYAETFIRDGAADQLCVDSATHGFVKNVGTTRSIPPQPVCGEGAVRVDGAFKDQALYNALIDAFSMRSFVPSAGVSGHDHFFATFGRFGGTSKSHKGEWLDEVATRAAAQNEQYLEVMETPNFTGAADAARRIGWPEKVTINDLAMPADALPGVPSSVTELTTSNEQLAHLCDQLLADKAFQENLGSATKELHDALKARDLIENCGGARAKNGCSVDIRLLYQVLRSNAPEIVFAQTLLGFEVAAFEAKQQRPQVVGINFVQPEDDFLAMSEYSRQMRMLDYLHGVYPQVHISLHAGELALGLVPPEGLRFHIREAVDVGHAERIGHGVDVMYEEDAQALLKEMADRHIMVEINLTSNDVILGVTREQHPLPLYRAARVPVALSTDDEGVSRIDLTHEYERAAMEFYLGYVDLKNMARTSLEHSFLPGGSLWQKPDVFVKVNAACAGQQVGAEDPKGGCLTFLRSSEKAAQEWELEHRYRVFEAGLPGG